MTRNRSNLKAVPAGLAGLVLALGACSATQTSGSASDESSPSSSPAATLTVNATMKPGKGGVLFIEGAVPEIRLVGADGVIHRPTRDHTDIATFTDLEPGDYTLKAAQRPCDGNCGYLDPPVGQCSDTVHVADEGTASVTFVVGQRCTISV